MPLLIFMIGTCFGSFISCMAQRYITHTSILGRSHCDYCGHTLHLVDLVPVLSYILLKGQCRYCHHKLNKNLLIHEVTAGFLFVLFYLFRNFLQKIFLYLFRLELYLHFSLSYIFL